METVGRWTVAILCSAVFQAAQGVIRQLAGDHWTALGYEVLIALVVSTFLYRRVVRKQPAPTPAPGSEREV